MSRVLVADDKETMLSLFERILPEHDVVTVSDGAQALGLIAAGEAFDVVVSDIQMPKIDGVTVAKTIIDGKGPNSGTPLVAMTANAMVGDRSEYTNAGMHGYISKPISREQIAEILSRFLGSTR